MFPYKPVTVLVTASMQMLHPSLRPFTPAHLNITLISDIQMYRLVKIMALSGDKLINDRQGLLAIILYASIFSITVTLLA